MRNKVTCYLDTLHEYELLFLVHLNTRKKWSIHGLHLYLVISLGFSLNSEYPKLIKRKKSAMARCDVWFFMARHQTCYNHCLHELERTGQFQSICFLYSLFFSLLKLLCCYIIIAGFQGKKKNSCRDFFVWQWNCLNGSLCIFDTIHGDFAFLRIWDIIMGSCFAREENIGGW